MCRNRRFPLTKPSRASLRIRAPLCFPSAALTHPGCYKFPCELSAHFPSVISSPQKQPFSRPPSHLDIRTNQQNARKESLSQLYTQSETPLFAGGALSRLPCRCGCESPRSLNFTVTSPLFHPLCFGMWSGSWAVRLECRWRGHRGMFRSCGTIVLALCGSTGTIRLQAGMVGCRKE